MDLVLVASMNVRLSHTSLAKSLDGCVGVWVLIGRAVLHSHKRLNYMYLHVGRCLIVASV